jgi:HD-GYP domain-containing protein (c-di-GMP phosphodiesterase class II)
LLEEQEHLMEGFVDACVTAIEARDPVTSGHSMRVAAYSVGLAEAVNRTDTGVLKDIAFTTAQIRELRFASRCMNGRQAWPKSTPITAPAAPTAQAIAWSPK